MTSEIQTRRPQKQKPLSKTLICHSCLFVFVKAGRVKTGIGLLLDIWNRFLIQYVFFLDWHQPLIPESQRCIAKLDWVRSNNRTNRHLQVLYVLPFSYFTCISCYWGLILFNVNSRFHSILGFLSQKLRTKLNLTPL